MVIWDTKQMSPNRLDTAHTECVFNTHRCYEAVLSNKGDTEQRESLRAQAAHPVEAIA